MLGLREDMAAREGFCASVYYFYGRIQYPSRNRADVSSLYPGTERCASPAPGSTRIGSLPHRSRRSLEKLSDIEIHGRTRINLQKQRASRRSTKGSNRLPATSLLAAGTV